MADNTDGHENKDDDLTAYHDDRVRGGVVSDFDHQERDRQKDGDEQKCSPSQQLHCHVSLP